MKICPACRDKIYDAPQVCPRCFKDLIEFVLLEYVRFPCECGDLGTNHIIHDATKGFGSCKGGKPAPGGINPCNCHRFRPVLRRDTSEGTCPQKGESAT